MYILFKYTRSFFVLKNCLWSLRCSSAKHSQNKTVLKHTYLMKRDEIPLDYELIYRAPMETYISIAKNISTITAIIISSATAYAATNQYKLPAASFESLGLVSDPNDFWIFCIGFIAITVIIRLFVARYPLRIYRANEKYVAVYDSQIPLRPSKHMFCKGEVEEIYSKFNPWNNCTYRLGTRTSILLSRYFRTPADYNQMLGYN